MLYVISYTQCVCLFTRNYEKADVDFTKNMSTVYPRRLEVSVKYGWVGELSAMLGRLSERGKIYPVLRDLSRVEGEENLVPHFVAFLLERSKDITRNLCALRSGVHVIKFDKEVII